MIENLHEILLDHPDEGDVNTALIALYNEIDCHFQLVDHLLGMKGTPQEKDELLLEHLSCVLVIKRFYQREILDKMGIPEPSMTKHDFFDAPETGENAFTMLGSALRSQVQQFRMAAGTISMIVFVVTRNVPRHHSIDQYNALQQFALPSVEKWFAVLENHVEFLLEPGG